MWELGVALIVPTLCVGMPSASRLQERTQSVQGCIPTQSVGTIIIAGKPAPTWILGVAYFFSRAEQAAL